jgi:ADP-heptose:LPS heptosyltransferase
MKRWDVEKYSELSRRLVATHGYNLLLMGDKNDMGASSHVAAGLGSRCVDITGSTNLLEGAAYLKQCKAFVGNDSGLMHLAEAVSVPVVTIFGPTVEAFGYYPSLPRSKTVEKNIPCRPCSRNGSRPCHLKSHECLVGIDVDTVESALLELLNDTGPNRYILES